MRCRSGGAEFVVLGFLVSSRFVSSEIALIGSSSLVSRSTSSSNHTSSSREIFAVFFLSFFILIFWVLRKKNSSSLAVQCTIGFLIHLNRFGWIFYTTYNSTEK